MALNRYYCIIFSLFLFLVSCQNEDGFDNAMGYLYLEATADTGVNTKSTVSENYKPKQLHVEIRNAAGVVMQQTDDFDTEWKGKQLTLAAGNYTIVAHSHGFDGQASGFNNPYYQGSTTVTIEAGKPAMANIICTLANVKVTVQFDNAFVQAFASAKVKISSAVSGIQPIEVEKGSTNIPPIYMPVGDLTATVTVQKNMASTTQSLSKAITEVKARDHYILKYKIQDQGKGSIKVEADPTEREFRWTFAVPTVASTTLQANAAIAWSSFALLEGEVPSAVGTLDPTAMRFEWKKASDSNWSTLATDFSDKKYTAKLTGLDPNTTYTYRMVYTNDSESYTSNEVAFTTESAIALYNGQMEIWSKPKNAYYPDTETNVQSGNNFWDTSNPGSADFGFVVTSPNSETIHEGKYSAQLTSQYALVKFAAASLYTGKFGSLNNDFSGASLRFGQPFTSRPTQFRGWFKYEGKNINRRPNEVPAEIPSTGRPDLCSAYIALVDLGLADGIYVNNADMSTFPDYNTDDRVVAYGALPDSECGNTDWKQFTIDLVYRNLTRKPTHIIIVISSSKYGDYFTGGEGSTLYVDDLELIYGDDPKTK